MPGPDSKNSQAPHNPLEAQQVGKNLPEHSSRSLALRSDTPVLARLGKGIAAEIFQRSSLPSLGDLQAQLMLAAKEGRADAVERLLAAGAEADVPDAEADFPDNWKTGVTPLWWASVKGHAEVVKLLLAAGANVEAAADKSLSMLYWACFHGHAEVVKLLLAAGANVNARGTPLNSASWFGDAEVVKLLLAAGADVNTVSTLDGTTPLSNASQKGHADVIKLLKAAGAKK